ncbi:MAG: Ig-like domain-containing protein [Rubrivivax sp.]
MNGSTSGRRPLIAAALAAALLAVAALAASCGGGGAGSAPDGGADAGAGSGAGSGDSGGGGGGSGGGGGGGQAPADPVASIDSPPAGTLFSAGETLTFAGSGSDAIDGTLSSNAFTWWVDLHHDTHTHPFRLPASGAAGTVTIPTRGETSDNVFYRFHLRATNSAGRAVEVTRDVLPRKAQVTLATVPSGLRLALEGQPVLAPHTFTGVVGLERDIAAVDHAAGGRRWRFDGWSHGGAGSQVIVTPAEATTYTANFTDIGTALPMPPTVSLSAPGSATAGVPVTLTASATDSDGLVVRVDFLAGETLLGSATAAPFTFAWTPAAAAAGTTASLRARASDDSGLSADSAVVAVIVVAPTPGDAVPPTITLAAPLPLADGIDGVLALSAEASDDTGVVAVEFQVDGAAVGSEVTAAPCATTVDSTRWASGQHVVRAAPATRPATARRGRARWCASRGIARCRPASRRTRRGCRV